jgi:hypothetical protein
VPSWVRIESHERTCFFFGLNRRAIFPPVQGAATASPQLSREFDDCEALPIVDALVHETIEHGEPHSLVCMRWLLTWPCRFQSISRLAGHLSFVARWSCMTRGGGLYVCRQTHAAMTADAARSATSDWALHRRPRPQRRGVIVWSIPYMSTCGAGCTCRRRWP